MAYTLQEAMRLAYEANATLEKLEFNENGELSAYSVSFDDSNAEILLGVDNVQAALETLDANISKIINDFINGGVYNLGNLTVNQSLDFLSTGEASFNIAFDSPTELFTSIKEIMFGYYDSNALNHLIAHRVGYNSTSVTYTANIFGKHLLIVYSNGTFNITYKGDNFYLSSVQITLDW